MLLYDVRLAVLCQHGCGHSRTHTAYLDDADHVFPQMATWYGLLLSLHTHQLHLSSVATWHGPLSSRLPVLYVFACHPVCRSVSKLSCLFFCLLACLYALLAVRLSVRLSASLSAHLSDCLVCQCLFSYGLPPYLILLSHRTLSV